MPRDFTLETREVLAESARFRLYNLPGESEQRTLMRFVLPDPARVDLGFPYSLLQELLDADSKSLFLVLIERPRSQERLIQKDLLPWCGNRNSVDGSRVLLIEAAPTQQALLPFIWDFGEHVETCAH